MCWRCDYSISTSPLLKTMHIVEIPVQSMPMNRAKNNMCYSLLSCRAHRLADALANPDLACGAQFCRYLGLYKDEIEAAIAYDKEAVRGRGIYAVTNFDLAEYIDLLGMLLKSNFALLLWPVVH